VLIAASRVSGNFAEWYASTIFPVFSNTIGWFSSLLPFSVFELGIYIMILLSLLLLVLLVILAVKGSPDLKTVLSKSFRVYFCIIGILLLLFTLNGSINYSRESIAKQMGLTVSESTVEQLTGLCFLLIEDIKNVSADITADEKGLLLIDQEAVRRNVVDAMKDLGNRYPALSGFYPNPKPVILSGAMSYLGITGIYSPFTLESNYNSDVADFIIPYTLGHELAHFKGFMKEEEAGFIAYMACRNSSSAELRYSAALNALIYSLNALNMNVGWEDYRSVYDLIPEQVRAEFNESRYYWLNHTSAITSIAKKANEQYLIANAQTEGTKSYGNMVDLLLAEYADIIGQTGSELL